MPGFLHTRIRVSNLAIDLLVLLAVDRLFAGITFAP
jgi:hypothetical protein